MDARIGQLTRDGKAVFYKNEGGYVEGTLERVEAALGLRAAPVAATPVVESKTYNVRLTFQFPAWDEKDGIPYNGITAGSKQEANAIARRLAHNDGHLNGGQGRVTFTATEVQ